MKNQLKGSLDLPGSKSESNRALMIAAYGGFPLEVTGLSDAHDTELLKALLAQSTDEVNCEDAGTVARFLMTYLSCHEGSWLLTGTERLCQRPMRPLVEALRQLGADIQYVDAEGFLPVRIHGVSIKGGEAEVDASTSSQFISSLLLAAPMWENGLRLKLGPNLASMPYIDMTIAMMRQFGAMVQKEERLIIVRPCPYQAMPFVVSPDWSAASYWYEMAALSERCDLLLKGLAPDSLQGDAVVAAWYKAFGVETVFTPEGAHLRKTVKEAPEAMAAPLFFDFSAHPDLFPAVFVTCVALGVPARFDGTANLSQKESDRVESLIAELLKIYKFKYVINNYIIDFEKLYFNYNINNDIVFNTYNDHRIAMALAGLSLKNGPMKFDKPEVVAKSYPGFWKDMLSMSLQ